MQLLPVDLNNPDEDQERIKEVTATKVRHLSLCFFDVLSICCCQACEEVHNHQQLDEFESEDCEKIQTEQQ